MIKIRLWLNLAVNFIFLAVFLALSSTGLVLEFRLPHGQPGGGAHAGMKTYFGLSRHEWGDLHFWAALAFFALLFFHLVLHWNWIFAAAWGAGARPQPFWRKSLTLLLILFALTACLFPFLP